MSERHISDCRSAIQLGTGMGAVAGSNIIVALTSVLALATSKFSITSTQVRLFFSNDCI